MCSSDLIVIELRADHAIPGPQRAGNRAGKGERHRRHVRPKTHAAWVGIKQCGYDTSGTLEQRIGRMCLGKGTVRVCVAAACRPVARSTNCDIHHLRAGGAVESRPVTLGAGEVRANVAHIAHFARLAAFARRFFVRPTGAR